MKKSLLALACFALTLIALFWLGPDNHTVIVGTHDLVPGTIIQKSDVDTFMYSWRYRMPSGTIRCLLPCEGRVIGHTVVRPLSRYVPITANDIN